MDADSTDRSDPDRVHDRSYPAPSSAHCNPYIRAARAERTNVAYKKDLQRFLEHGGTIPASAEAVAEYLSTWGPRCKESTLARWASSISVAHKERGLPSPCASDVVRSTLRGIRRVHGAKRRRVSPVVVEELRAIIDAIPNDKRGLRDCALLLTGFAAALRRSELSGLYVDSLRFDPRGMLLSLGATKTDQAGEQDEVAIPNGTGKYCPVAAMKAWLKAAAITKGPVFRKVTTSGSLTSWPLNPASIAEIIKKRAARVGLDPGLYSGHSLRSGFATSSARANKPYHKIKQQTRHRSDGQLLIYVRDAELFKDNASDIIGP